MLKVQKIPEILKLLKFPDIFGKKSHSNLSPLWHGINAMHETMDTGQAPVPGNHQLQ